MLKPLLSFLVSNHLFELSGQLFLWTTVGAVAGVLLGIGTFWLFPCWLRWWRVLLCGLNIAILLMAGGYIGLFEGGWRGLLVAARQSVLVLDFNAQVGKVEAVFLAGVHHATKLVKDEPRITPGDAASELRERLEAFLASREDIPLQELQRVEGVGQGVLDQVIALAEEKALTWIPILKETFAQRLLHRVLQELGQTLVGDQARAGWRRIRLEAHLRNVLAALPREAVRTGDPEAVSFGELTAAFAKEGLTPWLLEGAMGYVRFQQLLALLVAGGLVLLPPAGCWAFRKRRAEPIPTRLSGGP